MANRKNVCAHLALILYADEKFFYLTVLLAPVMALTLSSCIKDPDWGRTLEPSQLEAEAARAFFEHYAASLPMEFRPVGITPGNFAPEWGKAIPTSSGGVACRCRRCCAAVQLQAGIRQF